MKKNQREKIHPQVKVARCKNACSVATHRAFLPFAFCLLPSQVALRIRQSIALALLMLGLVVAVPAQTQPPPNANPKRITPQQESSLNKPIEAKQLDLQQPPEAKPLDGKQIVINQLPVP